ncbi:hypothetical protein EVAR_53788_1 [Eumeta japonica]|uniref:Uncharacterized protein n=1 Tax=Eumeta variegata TaxID=151549 RepID=A0A4C1XZ05_EUMVA|nr:hypothetical protein EVAR_53788_1 [Eumeta japonica]
MIVNGFEEGLPKKCPVVGNYEDTGSMQCPMWNRWAHRQPSVRAFEDYGADIVYPQCDPLMQCYMGRDGRTLYPTQHQYSVAAPPPPPPPLPPPLYLHPQQAMVRRPIVPNLPCNQGVEPWNYNTCFDVDGQPCRYTNIVDLEDFM